MEVYTVTLTENHNQNEDKHTEQPGTPADMNQRDLIENALILGPALTIFAIFGPTYFLISADVTFLDSLEANLMQKS